MSSGNEHDLAKKDLLNKPLFPNRSLWQNVGENNRKCVIFCLF